LPAPTFVTPIRLTEVVETIGPEIVLAPELLPASRSVRSGAWVNTAFVATVASAALLSVY